MIICHKLARLLYHVAHRSAQFFFVDYVDGNRSSYPMQQTLEALCI